MGKRKKEHRKRVQARNKRLEQSRQSFRNKFQEELLKQIELEKKRIADNGGSPETSINTQKEEGLA